MLSFLKKYRKDRRGDTFFMFAFCSVVVFFMLMFALEVIKVFSTRYEVETYIRRLCNNVVEDNIDFVARRDGYNYLNTDAARTDFLDKFNYYTVTEQVPNDYVTPSGVVYGTRFASVESGQFLYMIDITDLDLYRGDGTDGYTDPVIVAKGNIAIANSIPGMLDKFVFDIPIVLSSTNFRTDGNTGIETLESNTYYTP